MKVEEVEIRLLRLPLKAPFHTSSGSLSAKECILVAARSAGLCGHGESAAFSQPFYTEETNGTVWHLLEEHLIPQVLGRDFQHPGEIGSWFHGIRRNFMAIAAIETAVWDLWCKANGVSLASALGGSRAEIDVGVSIGIEGTLAATLDGIRGFLDQGYKKIKVKIRPGRDVSLIAAIRGKFGGDVPLMADANSAYTLADMPVFRELDTFGLMMIEQPLAHDDLVDHARLQSELRTPLCLDESIHSPDAARQAIKLGSCRIVNIKTGRVGGLAAAKAIHDLCRERGVPVWCGGMLELGVGRAHNIALASLPNFSIPGDTSPSARSFAEDIVAPPIEFSAPGRLAVPQGAGIGYAVDAAAVVRFTLARESFSAAP